MNIREGESVWTKKEIVKSSLLFVLHLVILIFIAAILLLGDKFDRFSQTIKENRTNYLYMTFCIFLLVLITYFYYFFEDRRMLIGGKNIALIFTVLDLSLIVSFLFGKYVHIMPVPWRSPHCSYSCWAAAGTPFS